MIAYRETTVHNLECGFTDIKVIPALYTRLDDF